MDEMTNAEALHYHRENYQSFVDAMWDGTDSNPYDAAFRLAIIALKKQIERKPKANLWDEWFECPICGGIVSAEDGRLYNYCPDCGQAIKEEGMNAE